MARRFRFPLETLLMVRRLREREAQRKVAAQRAEIARLDRLDQADRREIARQQAELLSAQRQPRLDPRELARGWAWIAHLRRNLAGRMELRAQLAAALTRRQAEYQQARQATKVIETLRERRWSEYVRASRRQEQAGLDEVAQQLHVRATVVAPVTPPAPDRHE